MAYEDADTSSSEEDDDDDGPAAAAATVPTAQRTTLGRFNVAGAVGGSAVSSDTESDDEGPAISWRH